MFASTRSWNIWLPYESSGAYPAPEYPTSHNPSKLQISAKLFRITSETFREISAMRFGIADDHITQLQRTPVQCHQQLSGKGVFPEFFPVTAQGVEERNKEILDDDIFSEFETQKRQNRLRGKADEDRIILTEIRVKDLGVDFQDPPEITLVQRADHLHFRRGCPQQFDFLIIADVIGILSCDK